MKKILLILLLSIMGIQIIPQKAEARFMNRLKDGFYFEKCKTTDKAREEYYKQTNYYNRLKQAKEEIRNKYDKADPFYSQKIADDFRNLSILTAQDEKNIIELRKEKNYKNDAVSELLKLHPIGSSVDDLVNTLERAGTRENTPKTREENGGWSSVKIFDKLVRIGNFRSFVYQHRTFNSIFPRQWKLFVVHNENNKLIDLRIQIYQGE